jgi:hypothetical protein
MTALIQRVRILTNDLLPANSGQIFDDQTVQDVLDASRMDVKNGRLTPRPTFNGSSLLYQDYYSELGDWEDDAVFKQYLTVSVLPSSLEPIAGHWGFTTSVLPPVFISGKSFDIYRAAADLLERQAAKWTLEYSFTSDGQSFQRGQAIQNLLMLAKGYRQKQRPRSFSFGRSDLRGDNGVNLGLGAIPVDYLADGNGGR